MQGGHIDAGTSVADARLSVPSSQQETPSPLEKNTSEPLRQSYLCCAIAVGKRAG